MQATDAIATFARLPLPAPATNERNPRRRACRVTDDGVVLMTAPERRLRRGRRARDVVAQKLGELFAWLGQVG